ncbi:MAG: G-protein coupled receptor, partial [Gammaproteobacteria bacterium]|nr:G-protein coupled receptor [Gammaproteobacteria bacterium]
MNETSSHVLLETEFNFDAATNSIQIVLALFAIVSNILIVATILSTQRLRISFNFMLAGLAVADGLNGLSAWSVSFQGLLTLGKQESSRTCMGKAFILICGLMFGQLMMAGVAIDRFLAALKPVWYFHLNKARFSLVYFCTCFIVSLLSSSMVYLAAPDSSVKFGTVCRGIQYLQKWYMVFINIMAGVQAFLVVIITCATIPILAARLRRIAREKERHHRQLAWVQTAEPVEVAGSKIVNVVILFYLILYIIPMVGFILVSQIPGTSD